MMPRHKRMLMVGGILLGVGAAAWLGTLAFQANVGCTTSRRPLWYASTGEHSFLHRMLS